MTSSSAQLIEVPFWRIAMATLAAAMLIPMVSLFLFKGLFGLMILFALPVGLLLVPLVWWLYRSGRLTLLRAFVLGLLAVYMPVILHATWMIARWGPDIVFWNDPSGHFQDLWRVFLWVAVGLGPLSLLSVTLGWVLAFGLDLRRPRRPVR